MALKLLTKTELTDYILDKAVRDLTAADVKEILTCIDEVVMDAISQCERVKVGNVIIEPKVKKATKARMGRNPRTGEEVKIGAKAASVRVTARVSKSLKEAAPKVATLKRKLA